MIVVRHTQLILNNNCVSINILSCHVNSKRPCRLLPPYRLGVDWNGQVIIK